MIRGRTAADGDVEFVDSSSGDVVASITPDGITGATGVDVSSDDITDAGAFGKTMLRSDSNGTAQLALGITALGSSIIEAVDGPTVRTAIGAGTSDLQIGTTATTAVAGNDARLTAGVAGTATVRAIGSTATTVVAGNDARLAAGAAGTATVRALAGGTATTASASDHVHTATQVTATAISPGTATTVQGILAELAARITALETP